VYFTVMGAEPEAATAALNDKAGWLHSLLFKQLHIHTVPTLHFLHDQQMSRGMAMNQLIARANQPGMTADEIESEPAGEAEDPEVRGGPAEPAAPDDKRG
jgi:ribosome-binding factor A